MKEFHTQRGHVALTTMTVAELRAALTQYPDDMPVIGTWEGQVKPINLAAMSVDPWSYGGVPDERTDCLFIDVDCQ